MTLESQKRKHQERHLFLQTASAHHNPEFLCSEASSLEDSVDTQRSGQQREGLRLFLAKFTIRGEVKTLVSAFYL